MRRRRVLAALATVASAGLAGCGADLSSSTSTTTTGMTATSSPEGPECAEFPPRIHVRNSLDRRVTASLGVAHRFNGTTASNRTVTVPPAGNSSYATRTLTGVAPGNGWYVVNGTAGNRTASYDWRVHGRCGEVLLFHVEEDSVRFDRRLGEG